jgi:SAM-dependent methyltransferase
MPLVQERTDWSSYYDGAFPSFDPSPEWTPKQHSMCEVLRRTQPTTVLDIGSNRGWYAQLAAKMGAAVVAFDVDEPSVSRLYLDSKAAALPILPLLMSFANPTPGYGVCNEALAPATERLRCDLVVALALVHHLVFKQRLRFEQIVRGLSSFSSRWLLIEFIGPQDRYVREWMTDRYSWYNLEGMKAALTSSFSIRQCLASNLEHRTLILCEKLP